MSLLEKGIIFLVLVISLTGLFSYVGGYVLNLPPLVGLVIATLSSWYIVQQYLPKTKLKKQLAAPLLFVALSIPVLNSFLFHQRFSQEPGLVLERYNLHDSLWHIALIKSLVKSIPPENPILAGNTVKGYHYFTDLFWVSIHQLTSISVEVLYLFISPILLASLFSLSVWMLVSLFTQKNWLRFLTSAMVVWGGSLAFYAPFMFSQAKAGDSVFWLDQTVQVGINQQLVLALVVTNLILWLVQKSTQKYWWLIGLLLAGLAGIKVYAAIVYIPIVISLGLWQGFLYKQWQLLKGTMAGAAVSLAVLSSNQSQLGWPFIFLPGWFIKTMFESGNHLNYPTWEIHRQLFVNTGNIPRLIIHWSWASILFLFGNLGPKLLGVLALPLVGFSNFPQKNKWKELEQPLFWLLIASISIAAPLLFIQKGTVWNTIQFMHFAQMPLWLIFIWVVQKTVKQPIKQGLIFLIVLIVTLPTTLIMIQFNLDSDNYQRFSPELLRQIQTISTVSTETKILVGSSLYQTSLVPAVSGRSVWWTDEGISNILIENTADYKSYINQIEAGEINCEQGQVLVKLEGEEVMVKECPLDLN